MLYCAVMRYSQKRDDVFFFKFNPIPLTSCQFVNRHIFVFVPSRPMDGVIAKLAQFGLPVLAISTLSVLSPPTTLIVFSKNSVAKLLSFLHAVPTLSSRIIQSEGVAWEYVFEAVELLPDTLIYRVEDGKFSGGKIVTILSVA